MRRRPCLRQARGSITKWSSASSLEPATALDVLSTWPMQYLADAHDERKGGFDIEVEMHLRAPKAQAPVRLSRGSFRDSYWTVAQMVAHQSSNGCNLQTGDLVGTGTLSGAAADSLGS